MIAEVVYFPKKCPKCFSRLLVIRKFSGQWWYQCSNDSCTESK